MTEKWHIKKDGGVAKCDASIRDCPRGGHENHYPDQESAQKAFESQNSDRVNTILSKKDNASKTIDQQNKQINFMPDDPETFTLPALRTDGATISVQVAGSGIEPRNSRVLQAWFEHPEKGPVSYTQLLVRDETYQPEAGMHLAMCDIETKPAERGKGYALELRQTLEKSSGLKIYSSGSMTPEGFKAFGEHCRMLPGSETTRTEPKANFNSMGFVASWKNKIPQHMSRTLEYSPEQYEAQWKMHEDGVFDKIKEKEILWVDE